VDQIGLGQYFRGITEQLLFGVRGNLPYRMHISEGKQKRSQGITAIHAPRGEHSEKPEETYVEHFLRGF